MIWFWIKVQYYRFLCWRDKKYLNKERKAYEKRNKLS